MPDFDVFALGCGGGPNEINLSCYFIKPCDALWSDGVISLEAGSGIGTLKQLLLLQPELFGTRPAGGNAERQPYTAAEIYSWIRCFLVTHAHLDHVNGLVLSAGSLGGDSRAIYGARSTLENLGTIFMDRIWPNLASWDDNGSPLVLRPLAADGEYSTVSSNVSVRTMPISHGRNSTLGTYEASAFFVRHDTTAREFLFFGDVEPDSIATKRRNRSIWQVAARKLPHELSTIFIECSWPSGRPDDLLFGHLSPEHLAAELTVLAAEVVDFRQGSESADTSEGSELGPDTRPPKRQRLIEPDEHPSLKYALQGLRVYIIHCKDDLTDAYDRPIRHVITDQVRALVGALELGVEIIALDQGTHISI